jgi:hypothetical protein
LNSAAIAAVAIVAAAILLFGVGAMLPSKWNVGRATKIAAPAEAIYPLIASFRSGWSQWNPWLEPSMVTSYSGPESGAGATQSWTGGDTGGGVIRITRAESPRTVEFSLSFGPFPITGRIHITPDGDGTSVTWDNSGQIAGLPVYRFMRFGLGRFVGAPMDRGLATLKKLAEEKAAASSSGVRD